ncbi:aspartate/glutamate racemase family protein [Pyrofollis japonicus]|uniref:maleate cis-trans isomerase family protein n=1 Tax=Pyrofollis japonicus TaxID=3060460 RepID=UPI00295B00ED|nr:aspartate/glutamate racemase family protein [Pyrofollis japonicus]BEP17860.1 aspartate/glutamate racemase family protein [Pyrofollis japonicus]
MYGWRARIGLIVPSSNTTMEPEMWRLVPSGVSIHTARVKLEKVTVEELLAMEKEASYAARLLATADVDLIVYGCTTGSLVGGPGYDEKITKSLEEASGKPAIATATAVVEALRFLDAKRVALATPYIDEVNEKEVRFLEHHGFEVVDLKAFRIEKNTDIGKTPPEKVYRLARSLDTSRADAVFISCTNLRTIEVIDPLETDLGLPVISSNTATAWLALRRLGIKEAGFPAGRLLKSL